MTPLQQKINLVVQYIYDMTGQNIGIIKFKNGDNTLELEMLEQCYQVAVMYYTKKR